jgi:hypothetical protein
MSTISGIVCDLDIVQIDHQNRDSSMRIWLCNYWHISSPTWSVFVLILVVYFVVFYIQSLD